MGIINAIFTRASSEIGVGYFGLELWVTWRQAVKADLGYTRHLGAIGMKHVFSAALIAAASTGIFAGAAVADDVSDTLTSALEAYEDGDLQYAIEELEYAKQLMLGMKTDALSAFLPDAPEGWSREINTEMNAGLAMMGGGVGSEAEYTGPGDTFTITIMADNPMVGAMGAMIGNAAAMGAKIERVGREKFMVQDDTAQGLIDKRILVKAENGDMAMMLEVLKTMDFRKLGQFGN